MNKGPIIENINNAILNTYYGSPLQVYGNDSSLERYEYLRKTPGLNIDTINTQLKKKFYGNSTNRNASYIAEKRRVNQIGIYSDTLPIKNVNKFEIQNSVLKRVRNSGYIVPKKCTNNRTLGVTPTFDGRSISLNPNNPGGNKWYNLSYSKWNNFCKNNNNIVSSYYPDYLNYSLGTSKKINKNYSCNVPIGFLQSNGYASTYTNINNNYIFQPYNPNGF